MAVVKVKSTAITNRDAQPRIKNTTTIEDGMLRQSVATVLVTSGDTLASTYLLFQIPSNARISSLSLWSEDMGTTTTINIGLFETTERGGAAVNATLFASGIVTNAGAVNGVNEAFAALTIDKIEKRVWELAGLSADPVRFYDVAVQLAANADGGGKLSMKMDYVI